MRANAAGDKSKGKAKKRPVSKSSGVMKRVTTSAIIEAWLSWEFDQKVRGRDHESVERA